jgi:CRP-like cAMP-binding protein
MRSARRSGSSRASKRTLPDLQTGDGADAAARSGSSRSRAGTPQQTPKRVGRPSALRQSSHLADDDGNSNREHAGAAGDDSDGDDDSGYSGSSRSSSIDSDLGLTAYEVAEKHCVRDDGMQKIATLGAGDSFGELALLNNEPRAATIICATACVFMVIDRTDYVRLLKAEDEKRIREKVDVLSSLPVFSHLSTSYLTDFANNFKDQSVARHSVVVRQGGEGKHVYLVKSGQCRVLRTAECTRQIRYPLNHTFRESRTLLSVTISRGEWIGEHSALHAQAQPVTVIADTDTQLMVIPRATLLTALHPTTIESFREWSAERLARWLERWEKGLVALEDVGFLGFGLRLRLMFWFCN